MNRPINRYIDYGWRIVDNDKKLHSQYFDTVSAIRNQSTAIIAAIPSDLNLLPYQVIRAIERTNKNVATKHLNRKVKRVSDFKVKGHTLLTAFRGGRYKISIRIHICNRCELRPDHAANGCKLITCFIFSFKPYEVAAWLRGHPISNQFIHILLVAWRTDRTPVSLSGFRVRQGEVVQMGICHGAIDTHSHSTRRPQNSKINREIIQCIQCYNLINFATPTTGTTIPGLGLSVENKLSAFR